MISVYLIILDLKGQFGLHLPRAMTDTLTEWMTPKNRRSRYQDSRNHIDQLSDGGNDQKAHVPYTWASEALADWPAHASGGGAREERAADSQVEMNLSAARLVSQRCLREGSSMRCDLVRETVGGFFRWKEPNLISVC